MSSFFTVQGLSFSFDQENRQPFFVNLSCSFKKNTLNFIRGKNGAGKSTLFRIMMGKILRNEYITGTIAIDNKTFAMAQSDDREKLSNIIRLAPQKFDSMLADQFTFAQNLQLASLPKYPGLDRFVETATIPSIVDRFGIDYTVPAGMLSGGQRQILAILMALQKSTSILLLDEPTAALDDKNAGMVLSFLNELLNTNNNLTVLIICHDKELVEQYAVNHYYQIEVADDAIRTIHLVPVNNESPQ